MMSSLNKQKTSLEWFFNSPSANFPQANGSASFRELNHAYSALVEVFSDLVTISPQVPMTHRQLAEVLSFKLKFAQTFTMVEAFELLSQLEYIAVALQHWSDAEDPAPHTNILVLAKERFRKTLVSLISFAKESKDINFKSNVLDLVKRFESIR